MPDISSVSPVTGQMPVARNLRPGLGRAFALLHWLILAGTYGFLASKAFLEFSRTYDFLWYHLPRALRIFHLTTFTYQPSLIERLKTFPPLGHFVQGLSVWLTGRISAANGVGAVGFALDIAAMYLIFRDRTMVRWFLTFCLAVPLIVLHMPIGYLDLFSGTMVLLAFIGLLGLALRVRPRLSGLILLLGLTATMLSKFNAWPPAIIFGLFGLVQIARSVRNHDLTKRLGWALGIMLLIGLGAFPAFNVMRYGTVTTEMYVPLSRLILTRPSDPILNTPDLPPIVRGHMPPIPFLLSAYEINRFVSNDPYHWDYDENHAPGSQHQRMGGWFFLTSGIVTVLLLIGFFKKIIPRLPLAAFLCGVAAISTMLISLELRYSLFIPLIAVFLLSVFLRLYPRGIRLAGQFLLILCALFVLTHLPKKFWSIDLRPPAVFAPPAAKAFWKEHLNEKRTESIPIKRVEALSIFWAGPTFSEIPVIVTNND